MCIINKSCVLWIEIFENHVFLKFLWIILNPWFLFCIILKYKNCCGWFVQYLANYFKYLNKYFTNFKITIVKIWINLFIYHPTKFLIKIKWNFFTGQLKQKIIIEFTSNVFWWTQLSLWKRLLMSIKKIMEANSKLRDFAWFIFLIFMNFSTIPKIYSSEKKEKIKIFSHRLLLWGPFRNPYCSIFLYIFF